MKRFFSTMLLGTSLINAGLPVLATEIFAGGADGFGAQINDLGGAVINQNTGTNAQIGITGNGNVIKWDHLNVGAGNKLDYNFTQAGQVALNKVNGGVSKFAGTLSTSGENGHLIISNPSGMVFMNGSVVNADAGSATFTTHDVTWDGQKNGAMSTKPNGTKNGVTVGGSGVGAVPIFKVAKDLNIIAPGVDMSGADLFAGGTVSMYTNDGMTFTAGQTRPGGYTQGTTKGNDVNYVKVNADGTINKYTKDNDSGITLKNVRVATAGQSISTADGKIYLIAGNGMDIDNLTAGNIYGLANIGSGITIKNSKIGDSTKSSLQTSGKLTLDKTTLSNAELGFSGYYSGTDEKYAPTNNTTIDIVNGSKLDKVTVFTNGVINMNGSTITNSNLSTKTNIIAASTPLTNSVLNARGNIGITSSGITNTTMTAGENINTSNWTNFNNVKATAGNSINTAGGEISNNSQLNAKDIISDSTTFRNSTLTATNDITSNKWTYLYDSTVKAANNLTINSGAGIYGATLTAGNDMKIDQAYIQSVVANAGGELSILGVNASGADTDKSFTAKTISTRGGSFGKTIFNAVDNIAIVGSGIYNASSVKAGGNINISYGANIQNSTITADNNIGIDGSTSALYLKNVVASAINGDITMKNTGTGSGLGIDNSTLNAGTDIFADNAYLVTTKLNADNSIFINNSKASGNLTADAGNNIQVKGLTSDANVTLIANNEIDVKNITTTTGTIHALNADKVTADTLKANLVYLGGSTKAKGQKEGLTIGNANWYQEWAPSATSVTATNIEAGLDLRLLSKGSVSADGLKSGGDVQLMGNNIVASNIQVTDQKIKTHYPSTNTTTGLIAQSYDSWAAGWGLPNAGGENSSITLKNVNIADKAAAVLVNGFENVKGKDITTPILVVESSKNVDIDGLKVDDIHLSNLYYTLFGNGYFDTTGVDIQGITAFTQGRDITLNKSFDPNNFDATLDKNYGYKHNLLVLQYLNGDYGQVNAKNTNLTPVNYIENAVLDGDKVTFITPPTPVTPSTPGNETSISGNSASKGLYDGNEHIQKIAEDLDTIFRQRFNPRSFAASDDEIKEMKSVVSANTVKDESGTIKLNQEFRVY